ncbi:putative replication initiator protein (plasmid) [Selenomonas ruminantium subsp. lactilytica TAM6421]|uniref:Putative replication initiator protein n=1 Tax=Selenomonas ruminantium subsp. lactilytica (strain NBRC 103574 / TAM6421) TaxID=927704 RepID=I0GVJ9_SELRL|nr:replication initiation protein [Selenomonas ruminantium]BAL84786.1 putative replication initiator protein [Selenomonas ruminantium subsp. lactilytica TAM6421]
MDDRRPAIYQANPLIEARKPMNALEMRLFMLALQDVNPHLSANDKYYDKFFKETHILPGELKKIMGNGAYIPLLDEACDRLTSRNVCIREGEDKFVYYPIFSFIQYEKGDGLRIQFNNKMRELILDIFESGYPYTKISMKQIFYLGSAYAMRLLEIMLQYQGMKRNNIITRTIQLEELRFMLNVEEDKYPRINDFKRFVLDIATNEINANTQYSIRYEAEKSGRKIVAFSFYMDCSNLVSNEEIVEEDIKLEMPPAKKKRYGLSKHAINTLTTICGSNEEFELRMEYALQLAETRKPENLQGFLYNAIKDNYRQQDLDAKAAIEREMQAIEENKEWEQVAAKMFAGEIGIDEERPEIPFDLNNPMELAIVKLIKKALQDRMMDFTTRSRLEDHNMSVSRFIELYGNTIA